MTSSSPFDELTATLDYPMVVVTTTSQGVRAGCLVGFESQSSIDPARWGIWLSQANHTHGIAATADTLVVHVLRDDDLEIARLFGEHSSEDVDKFARCSWTPGPGGCPVLDGIDWFAGRILERVPTGDHTLHVLDVLDSGRAQRCDRPHLGFQQVKHFDPGHDT